MDWWIDDWWIDRLMDWSIDWLIDSLIEASIQHPGSIQEPRKHPRSTRRYPGSTQEAPRRHPRSTQEAPRRAQEASRSPGSFRMHLSHKSSPLTRQMQKVPRIGHFTMCVLIVRSRNTVNCYAKCSLAAPTWRSTAQGSFINTVRTPTAKDCLGN